MASVRSISEIKIEKLVHGGQGMGILPDGRRVFVWNALPGEVVSGRLLKDKKDYAEAIADEILVAHPQRRTPDEPASYLATSPWQILEFAAENDAKKAILQEVFAREHIALPDFDFVSGDQETAYRNKMEWGFWGDETGISLAHFVRGSHGKTKVQGSVLADPRINTAAQDMIVELNKHSLRGSDLKSIIIRAGKTEVVAALFCKSKDKPKLQMPSSLTGLVVYYSNPKSPASVATEVLQTEGDRTLHDDILGTIMHYDVLSFFQVHLPVFRKAAERIASFCTPNETVVDLYSGVGSIGIPVGAKILIESDPENTAMAEKNRPDASVKIITAPAENALDEIPQKATLIVDPPRAGLHADVIERIKAANVPRVIYLSCNPATQARDITLLQQAGYKIIFAEGYNFFPRTPHIENLIVVELDT